MNKKDPEQFSLHSKTAQSKYNYYKTILRKKVRIAYLTLRSKHACKVTVINNSDQFSTKDLMSDNTSTTLWHC